MITRIPINDTNPMSALTGIVRIHAHMMLRATPHFTVLVPIVVPTPMIDEQITCVVLTGISAVEISSISDSKFY